MNSKNMVKLSHETSEILFYCAAFLSFLEKFESWLEWPNTPLAQLCVKYCQANYGTIGVDIDKPALYYPNIEITGSYSNTTVLHVLSL